MALTNFNIRVDKLQVHTHFWGQMHALNTLISKRIETSNVWCKLKLRMSTATQRTNENEKQQQTQIRKPNVEVYVIKKKIFCILICYSASLVQQVHNLCQVVNLILIRDTKSCKQYAKMKSIKNHCGYRCLYSFQINMHLQLSTSVTRNIFSSFIFPWYKKLWTS